MDEDAGSTLDASTVADDVDAVEVAGAVVGSWCSGVAGVSAWEATVAGVSACEPTVAGLSTWEPTVTGLSTWEPTVTGLSTCPGDIVGTTGAAGAVAAACCSGWAVAGPGARVAVAGAVFAAPRSVSMPPALVCEAVSGLVAARVSGRVAVAVVAAVVVSSRCWDPLLPWPSPVVIALRAGVSAGAVGVVRPVAPAVPSRGSGAVAGEAVEVAARASCVVCARSVSGAWIPAAAGACAFADAGASAPGSVRDGCDDSDDCAAVDGASANCRSPCGDSVPRAGAVPVVDAASVRGAASVGAGSSEGCPVDAPSVVCPEVATSPVTSWESLGTSGTPSTFSTPVGEAPPGRWRHPVAPPIAPAPAARPRS
ncbi:hypothetical protein [Streptomyces lydicus]|uniref:hypothetical protein n=1 Tax=Streptomyces lydicus TaxID=47763 RepID=UPI00378E4F1C